MKFHKWASIQTRRTKTNQRELKRSQSLNVGFKHHSNRNTHTAFRQRGFQKLNGRKPSWRHFTFHVCRILIFFPLMSASDAVSCNTSALTLFIKLQLSGVTVNCALLLESALVFQRSPSFFPAAQQQVGPLICTQTVSCHTFCSWLRQ